jgi:preprotein translocase subunit YajC
VSFLIVMVLLLVVMYVLMIRPQRQRQQAQQSMIEGAGVGDDVLTTGGIYGTVTQAEGDDVVVRIAEGLEVHMTRRGIAAVLPPEEDEEPVEDEEDVVDADVEDVSEPLEGEAAVTADEEAVTSVADTDVTASERR